MLEIERKYLLFDFPQCGDGLEQLNPISIEQYYSEDGYRYRSEFRSPNEWTFWRIKKVNKGFGINEESEIEEIYSETYQNSYKKTYPLITKTRQVYRQKGLDLRFEIDVFKNLIMMEIELPSIDFVFEMPKRIQIPIIKEVTGMEEFSNKNLALRQWKFYK